MNNFKFYFISILLILSACAHRGQKTEKTEPVDPNKEKIRTGIRSNVSSFQKCFEEHLNRKNPTTGKILLKWKIETDGSSKDVGVVFSEFKDKKFNQCMVEAVAKIQFPIIEDGARVAEVQYPFVFAAEAESAKAGASAAESSESEKK